jgi:hypothetical protein
MAESEAWKMPGATRLAMKPAMEPARKCPVGKSYAINQY